MKPAVRQTRANQESPARRTRRSGGYPWGSALGCYRRIAHVAVAVVFLGGGLVGPAVTARADTLADGPNRPCRFQVREPDGSWSKLVGKRAVAKAEAAGVEVRKAPKHRRTYVPRFIGCMGKRFGVSIRRLLGTAWCENHYFVVDRSAPHYGLWQMQRAWARLVRQMNNAWWATRRAVLYIAKHGFGAWPRCGHRTYIPRWALRLARAAA